jgi:hypothetical protein
LTGFWVSTFHHGHVVGSQIRPETSTRLWHKVDHEGHFSGRHVVVSWIMDAKIMEGMGRRQIHMDTEIACLGVAGSDATNVELMAAPLTRRT